MWDKFIIFLLVIFFLIGYNINFRESFKSTITLNNIVDKIYIINLEKDTERLNKLIPKLKKYNIKYKLIKGVDGNKIKNNTKLRNGQYGCLLSHIKILKDALKNNYKKIAIFEDDIFFHKNFNSILNKKYNYFINNENYYDVLYLGSSQGYYQYKKKKWNNIKINNHYYKVNDTLGTFAFIINQKIIKKILYELNKNIKPIDSLIKRKILKNNNYKCFALYPNIITANVENISNTSYKKRNQEYYMHLNNISSNDFDLN